MKKSIFLFITVLLYFQINAQVYGSRIFVSGSYFLFHKPISLTTNFQEFDKQLPTNGFIWGGGWSLILYDFVIGWKYDVSFGMDINIPDVRANYYLKNSEFDIGFVLLKWKGVFYGYPYVGLGFDNYGIKLENNTNVEVDLNEILIPAHSEVTIDYSDYAVNAGLSLIFLPDKYLHFGINLYYTYFLKSSFSGFFFGIDLSFGRLKME